MVGGRGGPPRGYRPTNVGPGPNRSSRGGRGASSKRYEVVVPENSEKEQVDLVGRPLVDSPIWVADRSVVSAATPAALPPAVLREVASVVSTVAPTAPLVVVSVPSVAVPVPPVVESVSPEPIFGPV